MFLAVFVFFINRKKKREKKINLQISNLTVEKSDFIFTFAFKQTASRGPYSSYLIYLCNLNLLISELVLSLVTSESSHPWNFCCPWGKNSCLQ